jgi:hypothetical protein
VGKTRLDSAGSSANRKRKALFMKRILSVGILLMAIGLYAQCWPVITEVMAWPSTNAGTAFRGADFIELSNFGNTDILMHGWFFSDNRRLNGLQPLRDIIVPAGQSVIIARARDSITSAVDFANWWGVTNWGVTNLPSAMWVTNGLDERIGDEVWLYDANTNVVDWVKFGNSINGHTFVYDTNNGSFGAISAENVGGAWRTPVGDVGSPFTNTGPVQMNILQQPVSQTVFVGKNVIHQVAAAGMPKPRYQWYFQVQNNAAWEMIPGAIQATLPRPNAQLENSGNYQVVLSNGLSTVTSAIARLTIIVPTNCIQFPITILRAPEDIEAFPGQTAEFLVEAEGYQPLRYQWQSNGVDLTVETNVSLVVGSVNLDMSGTVYSVRVSNECSSTNVAARLTVVPRPHLHFTEIHASTANVNKKSWVELTNVGTNVTNLRGYRFCDTMAENLKDLTIMATITNDLVLQPGESVILLNSMSPGEFTTNWWGERHLPCRLQIFTFYGFSPSELGESLWLWNQAAINPFDTVATVMWLRCSQGVSLEVEDICYTNGCVGYGMVDAVLGTNGNFRADQDGDIGSPGYTSNMPSFLTITGQPASIKVALGANATFNVCANGTPERSYQWRKDGINLAGATNATLIVTSK